MSSTLPFTASKALKIATSQVGVKESGGTSNLQKYGAALGDNGKAWCSSFVWWCILQCGTDLRVPTGLSGSSIASVAALNRAARGLGWWHPGHAGITAGDLAILDSTPRDETDRDHIRFVITAYSTSYKGVGGNESGAVREATHGWENVVGYIRLPYKPETKPHGTKRTPYVVAPGDTLVAIAAALYGDSKRWPEIYRANRQIIGSNPNVIHAGMRLVIP